MLCCAFIVLFFYFHLGSVFRFSNVFVILVVFSSSYLCLCHLNCVFVMLVVFFHVGCAFATSVLFSPSYLCVCHLGCVFDKSYVFLILAVTMLS